MPPPTDLCLPGKVSASSLSSLRRCCEDENLSREVRHGLRGVHRFLEANQLDEFGKFLQDLFASLTPQVYAQVNAALNDALHESSDEALILHLHQLETPDNSALPHIIMDDDLMQRDENTQLNVVSQEPRFDTASLSESESERLLETEQNQANATPEATQPSLDLPGYCVGPPVNLNRVSGYFPGSTRWNSDSYFALHVDGKRLAPEPNADAKAAMVPRALQREAGAPRPLWTKNEHAALERGVWLVAAQLQVWPNNQAALDEWEEREWGAVRARGGSALLRRTPADCMCRWMSTIASNGGEIERIRREVAQNETYRTGKWSAREDARLVAAVQKLGRTRWHCVSLIVGERSGGSCRSRYENRLAPGLMRGPWTADEDALLARYAREYGQNWAAISRHIPGRSDVACRDRYSASKFAIGANSSYRRWSWREDALLIVGVQTGRKNWSSVAGNFTGRSVLQCQRRWRRMLEYRALLLRKRGAVPPSRKAWTRSGWYPREFANAEKISEYVAQVSKPVEIPIPL